MVTCQRVRPLIAGIPMVGNEILNLCRALPRVKFRSRFEAQRLRPSRFSAASFPVEKSADVLSRKCNRCGSKSPVPVESLQDEPEVTVR
jgi:hypothetical protein